MDKWCAVGNAAPIPYKYGEIAQLQILTKALDQLGLPLLAIEGSGCVREVVFVRAHDRSVSCVDSMRQRASTNFPAVSSECRSFASRAWQSFIRCGTIAIRPACRRETQRPARHS